MKKLLLILLSAAFLSCTSLEHRKIVSVYETLSPDVPVYLRRIKLEPEPVLSGLSAELPELVNSLLSSNGFTLTEPADSGAAGLDIFIHRDNYQYNFSTIESVTLTISVYFKDRLSAYLLYTQDSDKSLESFPWTFSLLEKNISDLASAVHEK